MKQLFFAAVLLIGFNSFNAQIYTSKEGGTNISFFSKAPMEDIEAVNKSAIIVLQPSTSDLQVSVSVMNFKFKNALMEEHFNENYMETEKYPKTIFKGKINETLDYTKDGENKVTVTGKLEMHGVTKDVTISGTLNKTGNQLKLNAKFKVKVADYNIKVPSMYVKNIAEEVEVTINGWADYVFQNDYTLKPLHEVEQFIKENKHLPEVPSEKEVKENGNNLGKMDAVLLQKIEELTLYLIEQNKSIEQLKKENETLGKKIANIENK